MRTTVGPLPPAVYWRRRAVVLGAVLLGIIVLFVSCSGDDTNDQRGQGGSPSSQYPTPAPASEPASTRADASWTAVPGGSNPSLPALGDLQSQPAGGDDGTGDRRRPARPAGGTGPEHQRDRTGRRLLRRPGDPGGARRRGGEHGQRGAAVNMTLTVKNIGTRTCSRDVGAGPQELYLEQGARKYWSSDDLQLRQGQRRPPVQPRRPADLQGDLERPAVERVQRNASRAGPRRRPASSSCGPGWARCVSTRSP